MTFESAYATFIYQPSDESLIKGLSSYLDQNAPDIVSFFKIEKPRQKAKITIIPTKKEFDEAVKIIKGLEKDAELPKWLIGTNDKNGNITYLSLFDFKNARSPLNEEPDFEKKFDYYKKTIVHEYVHFVNKIFCKDKKEDVGSKWLCEGLASFLSKQRSEKSCEITATKQEVLDGRCGYDNYDRLVGFMFDNYGQDYILKMLKKTREENNAFLKDELYDKAVKNLKNGRKIGK